MPKRKRDSPTRTAASSNAPAPATTRDASPVKKKRRAAASPDAPPDVQPVLDAIQHARTVLGPNVSVKSDVKSEALARTLRAIIDPDTGDAKVRLPRPAKSDAASTTALRAVLDALKASGTAGARDPRVVEGVRVIVTRVLDQQDDVQDVEMVAHTLHANGSLTRPEPIPTPSTSKIPLVNGSAAHASMVQPSDSAHPRRPAASAPVIVVPGDDDPLPETMMDDELGIPLNAVRTDDGALDDGYEWDEYTVVDLMGAFVDEGWSGSDADFDDVAVDEAGGHGYDYEGDAWSDEEDDYYYSDE